MSFRPIDQPRSKPPARDDYQPLVSYGSGDGKLSQRGEMPSGKLPVGGFNPVFSFKSQRNTYATRCYSPTSGGGKKVV